MTGRWMRRWLWAWLLLLLLAFGFATALITDCLPRPTAQEKAAVRALDVDALTDVSDGNAFGWYYLAELQLQPTEFMALIDSALSAEAGADTDANWSIVEALLRDSGQTRRRPFDKEQPTCRPGQVDCLTHVSERLDAVQRGLAANRDWLTWAMQIEAFDHFHDPLALLSTSSMPLQLSNPQAQLRMPLTVAAAEFASGRRDAGLNRLCRYSVGWRRVLGDARSYASYVFGLTLLSDAAALRAQMRAVYPELESSNCEEAFAPLQPADLPLCPLMRAEHRRRVVDIRQPADDGWLDEILNRVGFNRRHTLARMAIAPAHYCQSAHQLDLQARRIGELPSGRCEQGQAAFNSLGCLLLEMDEPTMAWYSALAKRRLDLDASLRLLGAANWLRSECTADRQSCLARLPPEWRSPLHEWQLVDEDRSLQLERLYEHGERHWQIPIDAPLLVAGVEAH